MSKLDNQREPAIAAASIGMQQADPARLSGAIALRVISILVALMLGGLTASFVWKQIERRSACECPDEGIPYLQGGLCVCRPPAR